MNDNKEKKIDKKEMFLSSPSGYMMPFVSTEKEDPVQVLLYYGDQTHPRTGEKFFHKGWDFVADHIPLYAVATGTVIGIGNDSVHDNYIIVRYGKYEVKYGHISEAYYGYGAKVEAGTQIAQSGDFLHFGVMFDGIDIDPKDFIAMLWGNIEQMEAMGIKKYPELVNMGVSVKTDYENDMEEIIRMMMQYLSNYMNDITVGSYVPPIRMQQSLRNIFAQSADKNYFFETIPDASNPLGLSSRAAPLASKVHNLLIGDFLNYMASRHETYLTSWSEAQKKNFVNKQHKMENL